MSDGTIGTLLFVAGGVGVLGLLFLMIRRPPSMDRGSFFGTHPWWVRVIAALIGALLLLWGAHLLGFGR